MVSVPPINRRFQVTVQIPNCLRSLISLLVGMSPHVRQDPQLQFRWMVQKPQHRLPIFQWNVAWSLLPAPTIKLEKLFGINHTVKIRHYQDASCSRPHWWPDFCWNNGWSRTKITIWRRQQQTCPTARWCTCCRIAFWFSRHCARRFLFRMLWVERFWFCSFCQDFNKFWILFFVTEVWPFWKVRELWSFDGNSSRRRRWDLRTKIWPVWERVLRNVGSFFHSFAQRFLRSDFLSPPFAPRALDGGIFLSTALCFSHRSQPRTVCSFQLANSAGSGRNGASTNKALNQLKRRRNPFDGTWAKHMFGL